MGLGKMMQEYVLLEQREDLAGHLGCLRYGCLELQQQDLEVNAIFIGAMEGVTSHQMGETWLPPN